MSAIPYLLFDDAARTRFKPLTWTRPVADLRIGILSIRDKWERHLGVAGGVLTTPWLQGAFPIPDAEEALLINARLLPDGTVDEALLDLKLGEALTWNGELLGARVDHGRLEAFRKGELEITGPSFQGQPFFLERLTDLFTHNARALLGDFALLTAGRSSAALSASNSHRGAHTLFLEPGVKMENTLIDTDAGPVWIGSGAEIMQGTMIRGPVAICPHSVIKMGAKIYGATTIGPWSKVGGEVNNSLIMGYSNKAHDGFLGNSVIGEWCNLGADTNNSNLRNDYGEVPLWDYATERMQPSGMRFCGLIMGDHARCGINTMFNTGTVVGVSANVFGGGFQPSFIPDFSWGGVRRGFTTYRLDKALEVAEIVFSRRDKAFDEQSRSILQAVFERSAYLRTYLEAGMPGEVNPRHTEE